MKRRDFFKILTTTGAVAATGGCQQGAETILPLVVPNEQLVPGVAAWFATVCRECPAGCGVLARNREGRVVKLEGNPDHPVNRGALCVRGQAALQTAYHPDRIGGARRRQGGGLAPVAWEEALKEVAEKIGALRAAGKGRAVALLTQLESGSLGTLMDRWTQALGTRPRVTLEPYGHEALRAANRQVFARDAIPYHAIEDADVVLSFGADFVETWLSNVAHTRGFAAMHAFAGGRAGTLIHVEPRQSLTASSADEWIRNAPGSEAQLALAVLRALVDAGAVDRRFAEAVAGIDVARVAAESGVAGETIRHVASALARAGAGLVIGGGAAVTGTHATETLVAINLLNAAIGAVGKTVRFGPDSALGRVTPYAEVAALVQAMERGEIEVLLVGPGVNPVFTLPAALKVAEAIRKVPFVASFAPLPDETMALAHLVLPDTHWLESWGDYAPREGVLGLLQPAMGPVRDARPLGTVLLDVARAVLATPEGQGPLPQATFEEFLRAAWQPLVKDGWEAALQRGGIWRDVPASPVTARVGRVELGGARLAGEAGGLALLAFPSYRFYDGRSAWTSWLHETPDAMTQTVWDAWVEVPAETARSLGVTNGDVLRVASPHGAIELPAYISASLHPGTVAVPIGHRYAPYHTPRYVAAPPTGLNPVALLPAAPDPTSGGLPYLATRVTLTRTGQRRPLALLQATHDQDHRELAQHVDLATARSMALKGLPREGHDDVSLYPPLTYPGYRWGLAIDVDRCVGCQACVVACQAENNVPVVGKAQAAYGRQLHWIRLERWADGKREHPQQTFLPMMCQHCEVAPCEPVCPVFAAYRTEEGLNGQVYNRCVGTRYCGNNCPYHVRRFNWFSYEFPAPLEVQLNPDVTVRQLGVMEKCTMCIQRIIGGKDHAKDARRPVRDGDILTACQQTCPTQAITFGNLKDDRSAVTGLAHSPRAYHSLEELGTRPSVTYLKKVTRGGHA